jgi:riboflavin kinase/FMN adenylyltransferase
VKIDGVTVSSSQVRTALAAGEVRWAARLLGRPYSVHGKIIHGDGRGRSIGIPTANLSVWPEKFLPKAGVYVCQARLNGKVHGAVSNVGVRPTFESEPVPPRVEAHILDFDADLYGESIELSFIDHLRDEQRFSGVQALVDQIRHDIERGRKILASQ